MHDSNSSRQDGKQSIKEFLKEQVRDKKGLRKVKENIRKIHHLQLTDNDWTYIENKYAKYCASFWFNEITEYLDRLDADSKDFLEKIQRCLFNIDDLANIPEPFRDFSYFKLLKNNNASISRKLEMNIIITFKEKCLGKIIIISTDTAQQYRFFQVLSHFIDTYRYPQKLIASLKLKDFCSGSIMASDLLECVKNLDINIFGKEVVHLKRTAIEYSTNNLFLISKLKLILKALIDCFEINQKKMDGREVIEIKGHNVALSEILDNVEKHLTSEKNIEEVRIISNNVHIDTSLNNKIWHGKNLAVLAKRIEVYDKIVWDVSGLDNYHFYNHNAGTYNNGNGKRGDDGYAGESGGNILILTNKFINNNNFTTLSNGGNGSKGQDGGDGKDGADGTGITFDEFNQKFPSVVKIFEGFGSITNYAKTIESITNEEGYVGHGNYRNHYVNTKTKNGNCITFSCNHHILRFHNAYLVYKGSPGEVGGRGGEYGLGGQGGYAGELSIRNHYENREISIVKSKQHGKDGENGIGGQNGINGNNGWDMGYMDHQLWSETMFYGTDCKHSCTLEYFDSFDNLSDSVVWCSHYDKYVTMEKSEIQHNGSAQHRVRNNKRQNVSRQNHSQSVRKKNVSLANYRLSDLCEETINTRNELDHINLKATQAFVDNHNQHQQLQQKHSKETINRVASHPGNRSHWNYIQAEFKAIYKDNTTNYILLAELKKYPEAKKNWLHLTNIELKRDQLEQLFGIHSKLKQNYFATENWFDAAKIMLLAKYRNATLLEISEQLHFEAEPVDYLNIQETTMYLVEKNDNTEDIDNRLNEYLLKNETKSHTKFGNFVKQQLQKLSQAVVKSFIFETLDLETSYDDVMQNYNELLTKEKSLIGNDLISFMKWIESGKKTNFKNTTKQQYDWTKCCENVNMLNEFKNFIVCQGPLSESYREQLAIEMEINIKVYRMNQDNKLILQDNHNASSKECIHVLLKNNNLIRLDIDEKLIVLGKQRNKKDELYKQILTDVEAIKKKDELDKYLYDKIYLTKKYKFDYEPYCDEQQCIEKIIAYFYENEKKELKARLQKLTIDFIGKNNILQCLERCFSRNGRHVSFHEISFLINFVLLSQSENKKELNIICWTISACSQRSWIDELLTLQLENRFKTTTKIPKWRKYLLEIENIETLLWFSVKLDQSTFVHTKCIEDCLYLLSNTPDKVDNLGILDLTEWPDAIKEKYWTCKLSKLFDWTQSDLSTAVLLGLAVENTVGNELMECFIEAVKSKNLPAIEFSKILSYFVYEKWVLTKTNIQSLKNCQNWKIWVEQMNQKFTQHLDERNVKQLEDLIKTGSYTSKTIVNNLPTILDQFKNIQDEKSAVEKEYPEGMTDRQIANTIKQHFKPQENYLATENKLIAVVDRVIELKRGFKLRDTQKLAILTLLADDKSTLAQVSTGEGKSLIVVVASILMFMRNEKVHIVTSSSVLAKRDVEINKDIYKLFGVDVGHNCCESVDVRKDAYSNNQVVYGDLSSFQRDYLLDKFYGINILGDHNFKNVIIDEVDSMLLDKGNNMLYLSHNLAGLDKLESVYIYIWNLINSLARDKNNSSHIFNTESIKHSIMNDLFVIVTKDDIKKLDPTLTEQNINMIWGRLTDINILDGNGKLLKSHISLNELETLLLPDHKGLLDRIDFLLTNSRHKERGLNVPNHLVSFVEQHIDSWISSAITAFFMIPGQHYVVDTDKHGIETDSGPLITILDTDTGTDQTNSQWDEALHQFLQLKHGCKISLQNLKAVFISNVSYFKKYTNLYGLTGTLGSHRERDLLQEIYDVDFVVIPTSKPKQFVEYKDILCGNNSEWISEIRRTATEITQMQGRSFLAICETVQEAIELKQVFEGAENVYTYTRDYEEFGIAQGAKELEPGQIIIATNLAGRGTDIKLTNQLQKAGGLHVCLTYLPTNIRIEQQAFGRAARNGNLGSGQLIFYSKKKQHDSNNKPSVSGLKKQRDSDELRRLSDVKNYYETHIATEEKYFEQFKQQYENLKRNILSTSKCLNGMKDRNIIDEILLRSILDRWAFWLNKNNSLFRDIRDEQSKYNLDQMSRKFISQLNKLKCNTIEDLYAWVEDHPVHSVKFGKALISSGKHEHALTLFDKVIANEPHFCEVAYYYKAYVLSKQIKWDQNKSMNPFKKQLREAYKLFQNHKNMNTISVSVIDKIKRNENSIVEIKAFKEQQEAKANIYQFFLLSIDNILGHQITFNNFINKDITEEIAELLYEDLLSENILRKLRVKKSIHTDQLKAISSGYRVPVQVLNEFLSKWEGKEIDERAFLKDSKLNIMLHSREMFWKSLVVQGILYADIKFVIVNSDKLKMVDPSLFDILTKESSSEEKNYLFETGQIFLYEEYVEQQKKDKIYFKHYFIEIAGKERYLALKTRGVLSFNKVALLNVEHIASAKFYAFDSIILNDLKSIGISGDEGNKILFELVERGILEKFASLGGAEFKLKIKISDFDKISLPSFPIYETVITGLLLQCFAYRTALEAIATQLNDKIAPIRIPLMIKPHRNLFQDLIQNAIIKPVVIADVINLNEKLMSLYGTHTSKKVFLQTIERTKIVPQDCLEQLFSQLLEKHWIITTDSKQYSINEMHNRRPLDSKYASIQRTIELILNARLKLVEPNSIQLIMSILEEQRNKLKTCKVQKCELKSFFETSDQKEATERNIFELNGQDQILILKVDKVKCQKENDRPHCGFMSVICGIALAQIVLGAGLSCGLATLKLGVALIWEGIGDILVALTSSPSSFGWRDYAYSKMTSMTINAFFLYLPIVTKCSKLLNSNNDFSAKITGTIFPLLGNIAKSMKSGAKVIASIVTTVLSYFSKIFLKQNREQTLGNISQYTILKSKQALELTQANNDSRIKNSLKQICERITSKLVTTAVKTLKEHSILSKITELFEVLGKQLAETFLNNLQDDFFSFEYISDQFFLLTHYVTSSVIKEIKEAVIKLKRIYPLKLIETVNEEVEWAKEFEHTSLVQKTTRNILDKMKEQIDAKIDHEQSDQTNQPLLSKAESETLARQTMDRWEQLLKDNLKKFFEHRIEDSILFKGTKHMLKYVAKYIQSPPTNSNEALLNQLCNELRPQYEESRKSKNQNIVLSIDKHLTTKYHAMVLQLMLSNKNSRVYSAIIRENIPMDPICVAFLLPVVQKVMQKEGIRVPGLTIIMERDNNQPKVFSALQVNAKEVFVKLYMKNNTFSIDQTLESSDEIDSRNICLYNALSQIIPGFKDTFSKNLRESIANFIEQDKSIQSFIQKGRHQNLLPLEIYDGTMLKSYGMNSSEILKVSSHVVNRFISFIRFGGMIQIISVKTGVARDEIVSKFNNRYPAVQKEDRSTVHMVRVGDINHELERKSSYLYTTLKDFLTHTQNVPYYADLWYDIDKFQVEHFDTLIKINFSGVLTKPEEKKIEAFKLSFLQTLGINIIKRNDYKELVSELIEACEIIVRLTVVDLHEEGRKVYSYFNGFNQ